ncbi:MAG TPA: PAS domain-containing protein, partial [Devosia sp.]|nr:PAS domain-containing protein [Devosia sp.]
MLEADLGQGAGDEQALLKAGALQNAIFNSANFSSIATDAKGVIQIFNVGAERMLGYAAADVMNMITPADISDPQELVARAGALSMEIGTQITPGFEALVFKASRGMEDIYELTYIRKDRSRFPAVVSVTALRDAQDAIIGYLLIGTDNTARKLAEDALLRVGALQTAALKTAADAINDARIYSEAIVQTIRQPLLVLNGDLRVRSANPAFYELFKVQEAETEGALVYELGNDQWDIPRLRIILSEVVSNNQSFTGVEVEHDFREIGRRVMVLNAIKLTREGEGDELILLAIEDITERKQAIAHQQLLVGELNHRVKNTLATVQAIASQTLSDSATMKEAREAFDSRLSGLATA